MRRRARPEVDPEEEGGKSSAPDSSLGTESGSASPAASKVPPDDRTGGTETLDGSSRQSFIGPPVPPTTSGSTDTLHLRNFPPVYSSSLYCSKRAVSLRSRLTMTDDDSTVGTRYKSACSRVKSVRVKRPPSPLPFPPLKKARFAARIERRQTSSATLPILVLRCRFGSPAAPPRTRP
jgi:hypothetical protein